LTPLGSGLDLFKEAALRSPVPHIRASFGRLLASAALSRLLLPCGPDSETARHQMPTKKGASVTALAPASVVRTFVVTAVSENMDAVSNVWRHFEQYFGALYDLGRGGFGNGLPLVVWDAPQPVATLPLVQAQGAAAVRGGSASAALAAWAEGRLPDSTSRLSAAWAADAVTAGSDAGGSAASGIAVQKRLQKAAHRARYALLRALLFSCSRAYTPLRFISPVSDMRSSLLTLLCLLRTSISAGTLPTRQAL
jgi:hypothetical protein